MERALGPASLLGQISTLRFPPAPLTATHYRDIFNRLSAMLTLNFRIAGDGVELTTPPAEGGELTRIVVTRESLQVAFDPTGWSADFAAEQLMAIVKEVAPALPIPVFVHQIHVLRKTRPLAGGVDARTFLLTEVARLPPERLGAWKRGYLGAGLRFVFPPQQMNELSAHELKLESFLPDPAKVYLEDSASFLVPMPAGQWDTLKANLAEANRFLDEYADILLGGRLSPDA